MVQEQQPNLGIAKRKAASRLGITGDTHLPSNLEVEKALSDYQSIYYSQKQHSSMLDLMRHAYDAMSFFKPFDPLLVGLIVRGTALPNSPITLHLFTDNVESIALYLMQHKIPFHETEKKLFYSKEHSKFIPCYEITFKDQEFRLMIFSVVERRQAPLSVIDGKPMRRLDQNSVAKLIEDTLSQSDA